MNTDLRNTIHETVVRYFSPHIEILSINDYDLPYGVSSVALKRHVLLIRDNNNDKVIQLVSKKASLIERRVLHLLSGQSANVPFSFTYNMKSNAREYICMQDVDYETDYSKLDIEMLRTQEQKALAHIHSVNFNKADELRWLPLLDISYIETIIHEKWRPTWDNVKLDGDFIDRFKEYIPEIDKAAEYLITDLDAVLKDEDSYTLIHNDLHPGNTLIYRNQDVFFIDWEEARYGSLYLDVALRFRELSHAEEYRMLLNSKGLNLSRNKFKKHYTIASRYLGYRYMSWFLQTWKNDKSSFYELKKYMNMAVL